MTKDDISAFMREMGRRGGLIGGKRRMETMTPKARSAVASKAARARWAKRRSARPFSWDDYPVGVTFRVWHPPKADWSMSFTLTGFSEYYVYFYAPEHDGDKRRCRKMRKAEFQAMAKREDIG